MNRTGDIDGLSTLGPAKALPDDVYDALLQLLLWGGGEPLAPLSIDRLAHSLGVSPTPVREALARLEHTGLVRREARRGYRVAPPMSPEQMAELVDARRVLEVGAIRRAMQHMERLVPGLESALARHEASAARLTSTPPDEVPNAMRQYFEDDWSFHQAILSTCGNRYLEMSVNAMSFRVHRMRQTIGAGHSDAPSAVSEHAAILKAVRSGDVDRAADAMDTHLGALLDRISQEEEQEEGHSPAGHRYTTHV